MPARCAMRSKREQRRGGPNDGILWRRLQASRDPSRCVMNGLDVSSVVPIGIDRRLVSADAFVQATGARQALLNVKDSAYGNRETIEFADAEAYRTAGNITTLPDPMTVVHVVEDLNAGAFSVILESDTFYSASNGGFASYVNVLRVIRAAYNYTNVSDKILTMPSTVPMVWVTAYEPGQAGIAAIPLCKANGSDVAANLTTSAAGAWRAQRVHLGGRDALGSQFWVGAWACTSIYSGSFDATRAARELAYWKAEYAI